jgi:hypothetical protein
MTSKRMYSDTLLMAICKDLAIGDRIHVTASDKALQPDKGWTYRTWTGTL